MDEIFRRRVISQFRLGRNSAHYVDHWDRVAAYGLHLGRLYKADLEVIELFALLHDSQRFEEGHDPEHGTRAALYASEICAWLQPEQMMKLMLACRDHDRGRTHQDLTIGSCWDADRLDLDRVLIDPDPKFMSTAEAKRLCLKRPYERQKIVGLVG